MRNKNLGHILASKAREEDKIMIVRYEKDYWITNSQWAIKLYNSAYDQFRDKYNSYKSTPDIPKINGDFNGLAMINGDGFADKNIYVIDFYLEKARYNSIKQEYRVTLTPFLLEDRDKLLQIFSRNNELGTIQKKYSWIIKEFENCTPVQKKQEAPIYIIDDIGQLVALIMPVGMSDEKLRSIIRSEMLDI